MNSPTDALPDDLARQSKFQLLTRLGFVARGMLYIVIALLVIGTGRTEDLTGALQYVGRGAGRILLIAIASGTATYGLWRAADAAFGIENPGRDGKAYRKRAAAAFIACIYLYLAYKSLRVLMGAHVGGGTQEQADTVLDLPGGELVLGIAALVMLVAGLNQIRKAAKCQFMLRLDTPAHHDWVKWFGRLGYAARGVIFIAVAWLIAKAAMEHDASHAGGMEQALDFLRGPAEYAVAAGLMLFGAFSLVEARYRRIHEPEMDEIKQEVLEKVGT
ncbi:MAG: DUF1206 domain-containing protein [Sphingomicrobium sp.]